MKILNARIGLLLIAGLTIYACANTASEPAPCPTQAGYGPSDELSAGQGGAGGRELPGDAAQYGGADGGALAGRTGAQAAAGAQAGGTDGSAGAGDGALSTTEIFELVSDDSWRSYGTDIGENPPIGWNTVEFDDRSWTASVAPNPAACGSYEPTQSWERANEPMWDAGNRYSAFFRKIVTLPEDGKVSVAKITSFADDDIAIWINGSVVFIEPNFGVVEGGTMDPNEIDLKPFLLPGANLIAIHAQDTIGSCRWAVVSGSIEVARAAR